MSHGQLQLRLETIPVATAIERAVEIARPVIDAGGHRLDLVAPAGALLVRGDLTRLAQVFSNLLINAAKYTLSQGKITLATERHGDDVVVRVTDAGIGLGPDQLPRIFEMFGQLDSAQGRSQGGLGIGLSLARRLVEMHGGDISAASDGPGQGSAFSVRLPLASATDDATTPIVQTPAAIGPARRILVVDDLRDSADSLALMLETMGHCVRVAYNGEEAVAIGASFLPEVALLDLGMPEVDGYELCRCVRAAPWGRTMTLIAQTGWGQGEDRRRTREAGFDHHLVKPIDPDVLDALLVAAFGKPPSGPAEVA